MDNLDSLWESSIVKLAQSGNAKALTFWINRYLVPKGICAQVMAEQPESLLIRVMCHHLPDADRLMQFIYQQFCHLNSEVIRSVRITAQMVGSSNILWEKSVRIPNAAQLRSDGIDLSHTNTGHVNSVQVSQTAVQPPPTPPVPLSPVDPAQFGQESASQYPVAGVEATLSAQASPQSQSQPPHLTANSAPPVPLRRRSPPQPRNLKQKVAFLKKRTARSIIQSIQWFIDQPPKTRTLVLGSSAVAVFALGCGIELMCHYVPGFSTRHSRTAIGIFGAHPGRSGTVQSAVGQVPVIHQGAEDSEDPIVTLMFSSAAALGHTAGGHGERADYKTADVTMTSLSNPLSPNAATSDWLNKNVATYSNSNSMPSSDTGSQGNTSDHATSGEDDQAPKATLQDLQANRVSVVNLAGSQMAKSGEANLAQTIDLLNQNAIHPVGAGQNQQDARRPQIFDVKGQRIAYLAYSDPTLTNALSDAAGISHTDLDSQIKEDIKAIRDQVDWVVVSFRWTRQLRAYPEDWQIKYTHAAIDNGADLVVGYQPGITQGAEIYNGRAIVYSLGDDIDDYNENSKGDYDTAALKVTLDDKQMKLEFLPVEIRAGESSPADAETSEKVLRYLKQASSLFDQPMRSPAVLDTRVRLSAPSAPNKTLPTEPFLSYPSPQN
jgi:hypothetical protein